MQTMLELTTLIDLAAVAALGWLVWRSSREWEVALGMQRAALDSLRQDLAQLIADAEQRAHALDDTLGRREQRLRTLVGELERVDPPRRRTRDDADDERRTGSQRGREEDERRELSRRPRDEDERRDPAEARLLRDLQVNFGAPRA